MMHRAFSTRILWTTMAVMVLAAAAAAASDTGGQAQPSALFLETGYSFPSVVEGARVKHDFVVRNTGDAALAIHKVRTG